MSNQVELYEKSFKEMCKIKAVRMEEFNLFPNEEGVHFVELGYVFLIPQSELCKKLNPETIRKELSKINFYAIKKLNFYNPSGDDYIFTIAIINMSMLSDVMLIDSMNYLKSLLIESNTNKKMGLDRDFIYKWIDTNKKLLQKCQSPEAKLASLLE